MAESISLGLGTDSPAVAAIYSSCLNKVCADNSLFTTAQNILMGIIGVYGYIKQAQILSRQVDLQERTVDQAEKYYELARDTFNRITLDAYNCQKELFKKYKADFNNFGSAYVAFATRYEEYSPQFNVVEGRAAANAAGAFDRAERASRRVRSKYACGATHYEALFFASARAQAQTQAMGEAYAREIARKDALDDWYFKRHTAAAEFVANNRGHVISGVNGGMGGVTSGLSAIGNAQGAIQSAVAGLTGAMGDQASFFGTLANGAFSRLGYNGGFTGMGGGLSPFSQRSPSSIGSTLAPFTSDGFFGGGFSPGYGGAFTGTNTSMGGGFA